MKNSALFIVNAIEDKSINWFFAISPQVYYLLSNWGVSLPQAFICDRSPSRSIRSRRFLKALEKSLSIDCVFTMAGPSYVNFSSVHVQGISNPHITHPDLNDIKAVLCNKDVFWYLIRTKYQRNKSKKADYFIFQTESSRLGFCRRTNVNQEDTVVIPNAADLSSFEINNQPFLSSAASIDILCPAAPYPHKALAFIPRYAVELKALGLESFRFILTIPEESSLYQSIRIEASRLGVGNEVCTIGPYSYKDAKKIYDSSDLVFVPSLLETFSATYLEAFASHRPLIAADRGFARDVCQNAALYVEPLDARDVALKIYDLAGQSELQDRLVKAGVDVLERCDDQKVRTEKICKFLFKVAKKEAHV